jgi:hypothetical protein
MRCPQPIVVAAAGRRRHPFHQADGCEPLDGPRDRARTGLQPLALDTPAELKIARSQRLVRVEYRGDSGALESAEFPLDGLADDPAFHAVLRAHHVETIHSREATLDDVFVEITGRRLS